MDRIPISYSGDYTSKISIKVGYSNSNFSGSHFVQPNIILRYYLEYLGETECTALHCTDLAQDRDQ
jgi:hypothetical protein